MKLEIYGSDATAADEIIIGNTIFQSFTALSSTLHSFEINFATYKRTWIPSTIIVEIIDSDNKRIYIQQLSGGVFKDNSFLKFNCNLNLVSGDKYFIKVYSNNGTRGSSVTCRYGQKTHSAEIFVLNGLINRGELYCSFAFDGIDQSPIVAKKIEKPKEQHVGYIQGLISIVIPCYNSSKFIKTTLKSIFNQVYNNFEVIVIDDGSTDTKRLNSILSKFNLTVSHRNEVNKGAPTARNVGASLAKGEYIFFCDSDVKLDVLAFVKMLQSLHDNKNCSWSYCNYMLGDTLHKFYPFDSNKLKSINFCSTMSLIRRNDFIKFDESLKRLQDWDMFMSMAEAGKTGVWVDDILFYAVDRDDGITRNSIPWDEAVFAVIKKHESKK